MKYNGHSTFLLIVNNNFFIFHILSLNYVVMNILHSYLLIDKINYKFIYTV